jgi:hypothetical protein
MVEEGELQEDSSKNFCINLLKAMGLDGKESEDEMEKLKQDIEATQEMVNLPDEWVYDFPREDKESTQEGKEMETQIENKGTDKEMEPKQRGTIPPDGKKPKNKEENTNQNVNKWGPIQADRRNLRQINDGKIVMEKARV